jgi:hypothetical protein
MCLVGKFKRVLIQFVKEEVGYMHIVSTTLATLASARRQKCETSESTWPAGPHVSLPFAGSFVFLFSRKAYHHYSEWNYLLSFCAGFIQASLLDKSFYFYFNSTDMNVNYAPCFST